MALIDADIRQINSPAPQAVDTVVGLNETRNLSEQTMALQPLVSHVRDRFNRSKTARQQDEARWLLAYRNYRGLYGPDTMFTDEEKSKFFSKVTKTKVLAAYAQIVDVLFAGNKFPIGIEPTPVPNGDLPEAVHLDPKAQDQFAPGSATIARPEILGPFKEMLDKVKDKLKIGVGRSPSAVTFEPVKVAAKSMEKTIHDQLEESDASKHLRYAALELCLFGTGIIKGPFAVDREYEKWTKDGTYEPETKTIPNISAVSVWNFYPDDEGKNMPDSDWCIERHKLSRSQMRQLKKRPYFRKDSIEKAIEQGANYVSEYWESVLKDNNISVGTERFEVLEYWGMIDKETAKLTDLDIPEELEDLDEFQINAWICGDQILRLVLNPFTPKRIPYYAVPYEINPYSFFGIGVGDNMEDSQTLMNGAMRMMIDNAALSSNLIIEIDETNLVPGQSMKVFPGKVFRRQGGAPGQAIFSTKFQNVTQELITLYDKGRQLADEATGIPSFSHGQTGVTGVGRTASGMSMLMGAAAQTIKAVVRNVDDYLLAPLGKALFAFNMQFNFKEEFVGDLDVIARGTESLMRNEVRSQRLLQFYQMVTSNPQTAPFARVDYLLREIATSMDLDEDKVLNDPREAVVQATLMREMGDISGQQPQGQGQQPPSGLNDPTGTGGGTIAPGNAPEPNNPGFTGSGGGNNGGQTAPPQQQGQPI